MRKWHSREWCRRCICSSESMLVLQEPSFVHSKGKPFSSHLISKSSNVLYKSFTSNLWPVFCSLLCASSFVTSLFHTYIIRWNNTLLWSYRLQLKLLNMNTFLTQMHCFTSELLTSWSHVKHFLWWMDALFWASKSRPPFTAIIKLGRVRAFFNTIMMVFVWKKKVIYT